MLYILKIKHKKNYRNISTSTTQFFNEILLTITVTKFILWPIRIILTSRRLKKFADISHFRHNYFQRYYSRFKQQTFPHALDTRWKNC